MDQNDYNTICDNVKYLALKHETAAGCVDEPLVILTKSGVSYLKQQWGKTVNKNGKKCKNAENNPPPQTFARHADAQRVDNDLLNIVLPFYKDPER